MADGVEITGQVVNLNVAVVVAVCIAKAYILIFRTLPMPSFMCCNVLITL